ncbi:MAG: UDP-N-acetylmuramoyl-tripeptide--D-alanyl-D-alanine ligase [Clostridiales bacterium]|nr:UDP-N-acetylmuramoyl-tripeptide--D-alanyl-D-alanine ligase [Clostridiales bacterium]
MKHFTVKQFTEACRGTFFGPSDTLDKEIHGVVVDSRKVQKDDLFVATVGERADGHRFIPDVYAKGALCAVCQKKPDVPAGPFILVEDTLQALKDGAEAYRKTLDIPVIGITGSVGKTSTKEMVASVLSRKYHVLKTPGNFNNEIGLPLTIFMIDKEHEAAVLEMGMNHFGEMHRLSKIARPTHCIFTNIGVAHLEFLGSRDGILKAKTEMLDYAAPDAGIFVNGDDDKLITLKDRAQTFGLNSSHPVWADQIENLGLDGIRCRIHADGAVIEAVIPLPGMHMVYNAMAGVCAGLSLGLSPEQIRAGIEALKPLDGRSHILHTSRYTLLDDCYNANPVSMCAMLDVLNFASTRRVAILGDMGELGADETALHASVGEHLGKLQIDLLVTIGTLSTAIHETALTHAPHTRCLHFADRDAFLSEADSVLKKGDSILVKASHAMGFEHIVRALSD